MTHPVTGGSTIPVVRAADRHGMGVMLTGRGTPRWAADPWAAPVSGARAGGGVPMGNPFRVAVGP